MAPMLVMFAFVSHAQRDVMSYRAIRIAPYFEDNYTAPALPSDSVIFQFESYYADASPENRARFEQFVRLIPMVNRVKEIQTIIEIFGKDFYKYSVDEFAHAEDIYINSWFTKMPEDHSFWTPKFKEPEMRNIAELTNVLANIWNNPRSSFAFNFQASTIQLPNPLTDELKEATNRSFKLFKDNYNQKKFFPRDSLLKSFQVIPEIGDRYNMIIVTLQNMLAFEYWGDFEQSAEDVSNQIINDDKLPNSSKIDYLLCMNRLMAGYRPHFFLEEIITNYAWIRTILENPNSYFDEKLTKENRIKKLITLDNLEVQTFLMLSEYFPEHDLFLQEAWKILINYCEYNDNKLIDYLLLSEFKTKRLESENFTSIDEMLYPGMVSVRKMSEKWSLIQIMNRMTELFKNKPESMDYHYLTNRFYKLAMIHFRLNNNNDQVRVVLQNHLAIFGINTSLLADYIHVIPQIYHRNGDTTQYKWWQEKLGYLEKHYPDSTYFLPMGGVTNRLLNFNSLSEFEKRYFLTNDFSNEMDQLLKLEQFKLGYYFKNQSSKLSIVASYCEKHGAYEQGYKVSRLNGNINRWGGAAGYITYLFKKRSQIIDREKIRSKSWENKILKEYQTELKRLNSDLNDSNWILFISLIISVILVVISIYFYLQTRKTKNELLEKNKELEAISLSIGQIGHLAKNAVSEIHNSYFKYPTQYELDEGKKALKRLRNIFQTFEDNGSRITQKIDEEIEFAIDFVHIQNRKFSEGKSSKDIRDRIINLERNFMFVTQVPIYTVVNIIDNAFKHSNLNHDIRLEIFASFPLSENRTDSVKIKIICFAKALESRRESAGKGTRYIKMMLKNHSNLSHVGYRREINNNGYVQHILILPKSN